MREHIEAAKKGRLLKANTYVSVILGGNGWVYKVHVDPMVAWNEHIMLCRMYYSGYVPNSEIVEDTTMLAVQYLGDQVESWGKITDRDGFMKHLPLVLDELKRAGVRHGDLTRQAIVVVENKPMLIDFAESRIWNDPMSDKRMEGDAYWLKRTMEELVG